MSDLLTNGHHNQRCTTRSDSLLRMLLLSAAICLAGPGLVRAQDGAPPAEPPVATSTEPMTMTGTRFDRSPEAVARATRLFHESSQAYRTAAAVRDAMTVTVIVQSMGQVSQHESTVEVVITSDSAVVQLHNEANTTTLTVLDGTMYGQWSDKPSRFFAQDYEPPITMTMFTDLIGGFVFPQFPLMFSSDPLAEIFVHTIQPEIVGMREVTLDPPADAAPETPGQTVFDILIEPEIEGANLVIRLDPDTKLVTLFEASITNVQQNEGDGTIIRVALNPTIEPDVPVEEFVVNTEDRHEVDVFDMLFAQDSLSSLIGKQIPDFEFVPVEMADVDNPGDDPADEDVATISRASLMGRVILLAFWDAPSNGLYDVLPTLTAVQKWGQEEGYVMTIIPVNFSDPMEEIRAITAGLDEPITTYHDPTHQIAWNDLMVRFMPTLAVVAADGTVLYVHEGDPKPGQSLLTKMKTAIRQAVTKDI
ncbi:MAG: hypothetical protein D8M59_09415 [Planctomycetes bacterium]|nr:hypothetical protein [Planctomycetota bacterium]NOG54282.1 hypothetical protein [Planctomycetota bacterium]